MIEALFGAQDADPARVQPRVLRGCIGEDVETAGWQEIDAGQVPTNYERFVAAVREGRPVEPGFRHAADLQKVLDLAIEAETARRELAV